MFRLVIPLSPASWMRGTFRLDRKGVAMFVLVYVSPSEAVRQGKTQSGRFQVQISEEQIASLTAEQREELAGHPALCSEQSHAAMGTHVNEPKLIAPTWEEIVRCLQARIDHRKSEAEQAAEREEAAMEVLRQRKTKTVTVTGPEVGPRDGQIVVSRDGGYLDGNSKHDRRANYGAIIPDWPYQTPSHIYDLPEAKAWVAELEAENERRMAEAVERAKAAVVESIRQREEELAKEAAFEEAIAEFVRQHGSQDQIERQEAGLLPEDESLKLLRDNLFAPLDPFDRYRKLSASDIPHEDECEYDGASFEAFDATELPAEPWSTLKEIRAAAKDGMVVRPRVHAATCGTCEAEAERYSALVTVEWHGRSFSREYQL